MDRSDDSTISGRVVLYRRIPLDGDRVTWSADGRPAPSSQNFRDKEDELSVYIASETTPEKVLAGHENFSLVQFTVQQVRDVFASTGAALIICRDDVDPSNGHVLICGKVTQKMSRLLRDKVQWVEGKAPSGPPGGAPQLGPDLS